MAKKYNKPDVKSLTRLRKLATKTAATTLGANMRVGARPDDVPGGSWQSVGGCEFAQEVWVLIEDM